MLRRPSNKCLAFDIYGRCTSFSIKGIFKRFDFASSNKFHYVIPALQGSALAQKYC
jgi:hypothetical protein